MDQRPFDRHSLKKFSFIPSEQFQPDLLDDHEYMQSRGAFKTSNGMGFSLSKIDDITKKWIEKNRISSKPLLDVGCGFGFQTIAALESGRDVLAVDISPEHIAIVEDKVRNNSDKLKGSLISGKCGSLTDSCLVDKESVSGVLISEVIHFLTAEETKKAFQNAFDWLIPGGHLVIQTASPVICEVFMRLGARLQGSETTFDGIWKALYSRTDQEIVNGSLTTISLERAPEKLRSKIGRGFVHTFTTNELLSLCRVTGFTVEELDYYHPEKYPFVLSKQDEGVYLIAQKPIYP